MSLPSSAVAWLFTQLLRAGFWAASFIMAFFSAVVLGCRRTLQQKLQAAFLAYCRPLLMRAKASCRLFISPSSSGAERLSALKELSSKAKNRFSTWKGMGDAGMIPGGVPKAAQSPAEAAGTAPNVAGNSAGVPKFKTSAGVPKFKISPCVPKFKISAGV